MRKHLLAALAAFALVCPAHAEWLFKPAVTVSVGTSATLLVDAGSSFAQICNRDASKVIYWSWNDAAVTISTGSPLEAMQCLLFSGFALNQVLRAVTTSGTADVRVSKGNGQ